MTTTTAVISRHDETISWRRQFLRDVFDGLERPQKHIPCKYFYDEIGSALFDQICELDEYYLTRTELAILRDHAPEMAEAIGEDCELDRARQRQRTEDAALARTAHLAARLSADRHRA